jgi:hypothetical protein
VISRCRKSRDEVPHGWRIEKEPDVLRAVDGQSGVTAASAESLGAISQSGDAQRPLTHCDSYRQPGMLLLACRPRELRAIGVS